MMIDEQIKIFESNSEFERKDGDLQGCLNFQQLAEWLKELKAHRKAWNKLKNDVVAYHNNYDYDTAMHFLNTVVGLCNDIYDNTDDGGNAE